MLTSLTQRPQTTCAQLHLTPLTTAPEPHPYAGSLPVCPHAVDTCPPPPPELPHPPLLSPPPPDQPHRPPGRRRRHRSRTRRRCSAGDAALLPPPQRSSPPRRRRPPSNPTPGRRSSTLCAPSACRPTSGCQPCPRSESSLSSLFYGAARVRDPGGEAASLDATRGQRRRASTSRGPHCHRRRCPRGATLATVQQGIPLMRRGA